MWVYLNPIRSATPKSLIRTCDERMVEYRYHTGTDPYPNEIVSDPQHCFFQLIIKKQWVILSIIVNGFTSCRINFLCLSRPGWMLGGWKDLADILRACWSKRDIRLISLSAWSISLNTTPVPGNIPHGYGYSITWIDHDSIGCVFEVFAATASCCLTLSALFVSYFCGVFVVQFAGVPVLRRSNDTITISYF